MNDTICVDKYLCTGCCACMNVCPCSAIRMIADLEGFLYPEIDMDKCVSCGLCKKICPQNSECKTNDIIRVFGAINRNNDVLKTSSSGGVFRAIASKVLAEGGVVVGCAWKEHFISTHVFITSQENLAKLSKSKYVQSYIGDVYSRTKSELISGRKVLFSGTPCQIAGLKSFLSKDYTNLLCVDIVCHGVPSQKYFSDYIQYMEKKLGDTVLEYDFRYKGKFEGRYGHITTQKKNIVFNYEEDFFYSQYIRGDISRESCYKCKFADIKRVSDISLGDLWGTDYYTKEQKRNGASLVLINSKLGEYYFNLIANQFNVVEGNLDSVIERNAQLKFPSKRTDSRDVKMRYWLENGINSIAKKEFYDNWLIIVKRRIIDSIPLFLRKAARAFRKSKQKR